MKVKAIFLGKSGVGKSTLLYHLRPNRRIIPTIGVDCLVYKCLQMWDTSGDPRFDSIVKNFYTKMDMVVLVYCDLDSFLVMEEYRNKVSECTEPKWLCIYNGSNEHMRQQGVNYSKMYDMAFLHGEFTSDQACSNIVKNMKDYACPSSTKGWRYCWFN